MFVPSVIKYIARNKLCLIAQDTGNLKTASMPCHQAPEHPQMGMLHSLVSQHVTCGVCVSTMVDPYMCAPLSPYIFSDTNANAATVTLQSWLWTHFLPVMSAGMVQACSPQAQRSPLELFLPLLSRRRREETYPELRYQAGHACPRSCSR